MSDQLKGFAEFARQLAEQREKAHPTGIYPLESYDKDESTRLSELEVKVNEIIDYLNKNHA